MPPPAQITRICRHSRGSLQPIATQNGGSRARPGSTGTHPGHIQNESSRADRWGVRITPGDRAGRSLPSRIGTRQRPLLRQTEVMTMYGEVDLSEYTADYGQ